MNTSQKNFMVPLAFVGMMFFAIGFALGINSFLMPVLERSMVSNQVEIIKKECHSANKTESVGKDRILNNTQNDIQYM